MRQLFLKFRKESGIRTEAFDLEAAATTSYGLKHRLFLLDELTPVSLGPVCCSEEGTRCKLTAHCGIDESICWVSVSRLAILVEYCLSIEDGIPGSPKKGDS